VNRWIGTVLSGLLPGVCALCGGPSDGGAVCEGCLRDLTRVGWACRQCGAPVSGGRLCGRCVQEAPPVDRTVAALAYVGPARQLVHALKFQAQLPIARSLGEVLAAEVQSQGGVAVEFLVPVPLHLHRLRERGFNQAREVAAVLCERLGVALAGPHTCRRRCATTPQSRLTGTRARRRNVAGVFAASPGAFSGRRVALVDDVMTTGSTVYELARAVRAAGAEWVEAWVCCRTGDA